MNTVFVFKKGKNLDFLFSKLFHFFINYFAFAGSRLFKQITVGELTGLKPVTDRDELIDFVVELWVAVFHYTMTKTQDKPVIDEGNVKNEPETEVEEPQVPETEVEVPESEEKEKEKPDDVTEGTDDVTEGTDDVDSDVEQPDNDVEPTATATPLYDEIEREGEVESPRSEKDWFGNDIDVRNDDVPDHGYNNYFNDNKERYDIIY